MNASRLVGVAALLSMSIPLSAAAPEDQPIPPCPSAPPLPEAPAMTPSGPAPEPTPDDLD
jgi:hypothetical protein